MKTQYVLLKLATKGVIVLHTQPANVVKGFVLPQETKVDDITRLQQRFHGKVTVVRYDASFEHVVFADDPPTAKTLAIFARFASLPEASHFMHT